MGTGLFADGLFADGLFADSLFVGIGTSSPVVSPVAGRKPRERKTNMRSLVLTVEGQEQPYPTYTFSGRIFRERPKHNPFS